MAPSFFGYPLSKLIYKEFKKHTLIDQNLAWWCQVTCTHTHPHTRTHTCTIHTHVHTCTTFSSSNWKVHMTMLNRHPYNIEQHLFQSAREWQVMYLRTNEGGLGDSLVLVSICYSCRSLGAFSPSQRCSVFSLNVFDVLLFVSMFNLPHLKIREPPW